ncbi:probable serine/threonine-protein kinase MARK-A [Cyclopterus lumpus]|uniref:probable serine/threonine-protein kinase MARK-A n=1 Tax=Cyclopterus lumpus TaxID=8103 RepID=UPI0014864C4A|nr:probable serine/threonine-protein kinase MARK-A [Cyclopterus lumpus]
MGKILGKLFKAEEKDVIPGEVNREETEDGESRQRGESRQLDPISCEDISVVPGRLKRKQTEDGESLQREKSKRLVPIPCDNELKSNSKDISVVPRRLKRKQMEAGESLQREKSKRLDPIPCDNELKSNSKDISVVPRRLKRKRREDGESLQRENSKKLVPIPCDNELLSSSKDISVVPRRLKRKRREDGESLQREESKRLVPIPCDNELPSSSKDISVVPRRLKRKQTEDGESLQREKSKRLDPINCDNELTSNSKDISVVPRRLKRKQTEAGESLQREKSKRLDPIPCDDELPSSSEDTESRNAPEAALSERSAKRKSVADDGPVQKEIKFLDPSAMFKAKYQLQQKLGQGGFGCVYAGYRREDNLPVAIKHVNIDEGLFLHQDSDGNLMPMEIAVLYKLGVESERHSAHIDLLDWYVVDKDLILVLERPMPAVDLSHYVDDKGGFLKEKEAKIIITQLVNAAIDLQEKHIFHRDIKPENLLIETCMNALRVRVIDFGLSCFGGENDAYDTFYGTHFPPEWFSRQEYKAGPSTVYQIGVVLFFMRHKVASPPAMTLLDLKETRWLSENGKDFFEACICADPDIRFTLEQLRNHPWLR